MILKCSVIHSPPAVVKPTSKRMKRPPSIFFEADQQDTDLSASVCSPLVEWTLISYILMEFWPRQWPMEDLTVNRNQSDKWAIRATVIHFQISFTYIFWITFLSSIILWVMKLNFNVLLSIYLSIYLTFSHFYYNLPLYLYVWICIYIIVCFRTNECIHTYVNSHTHTLTHTHTYIYIYIPTLSFIN